MSSLDRFFQAPKGHLRTWWPDTGVKIIPSIRLSVAFSEGWKSVNTRPDKAWSVIKRPISGESWKIRVFFFEKVLYCKLLSYCIGKYCIIVKKNPESPEIAFCCIFRGSKKFQNKAWCGVFVNKRPVNIQPNRLL